MRAIISDIHGNLEALKAVLGDIERRRIDKIICLGDTVGYGPNPLETLNIARTFKLSIIGNHEEAVMFRAGSRDFRVKAEMAIEWTKKQLLQADEHTVQENMKFLHSLQETYEENNVLYVHGSPCAPLRDYVYPKDARVAAKMSEIFARVKTYCFCGHTHLPGVFTEHGEFIHLEDLPRGVFLTGDEKVMINVGSVGQPRDGDRRACYVTFDGDVVVFRRVEYNVDETANKIYAAKELDKSLGDRLKAGK